MPDNISLNKLKNNLGSTYENMSKELSFYEKIFLRGKGIQGKKIRSTQIKIKKNGQGHLDIFKADLKSFTEKVQACRNDYNLWKELHSNFTQDGLIEAWKEEKKNTELFPKLVDVYREDFEERRKELENLPKKSDDNEKVTELNGLIDTAKEIQSEFIREFEVEKTVKALKESWDKLIGDFINKVQLFAEKYKQFRSEGELSKDELNQLERSVTRCCSRLGKSVKLLFKDTGDSEDSNKASDFIKRLEELVGNKTKDDEEDKDNGTEDMLKVENNLKRPDAIDEAKDEEAKLREIKDDENDELKELKKQQKKSKERIKKDNKFAGDVSDINNMFDDLEQQLSDEESIPDTHRSSDNTQNDRYKDQLAQQQEFAGLITAWEKYAELGKKGVKHLVNDQMGVLSFDNYLFKHSVQSILNKLALFDEEREDLLKAAVPTWYQEDQYFYVREAALKEVNYLRKKLEDIIATERDSAALYQRYLRDLSLVRKEIVKQIRVLEKHTAVKSVDRNYYPRIENIDFEDSASVYQKHTYLDPKNWGSNSTGFSCFTVFDPNASDGVHEKCSSTSGLPFDRDGKTITLDDVFRFAGDTDEQHLERQRQAVREIVNVAISQKMERVSF